MSSEKSFIEKLNALKAKNSAERAKKKVSLPNATGMKREGDKTALDFYMEALYNMNPEDIQRLDSRQWERMFDTIYTLQQCDGIGDKVEKQINNELKKREKQKNILDGRISELEKEKEKLEIKLGYKDEESIFFLEDEENKKDEETDPEKLKKELETVKEELEEKRKIQEKVKKEISNLNKRKDELDEYIGDNGEGCIYTSELPKYYPAVLIKLYSNYRFSEEVYEYLTDMGKAIGEMLAEDAELNTAAMAINSGEHREQSANEISKNMLYLLYPEAEEYDEIKPIPVSIDKNLKHNGLSKTRNIALNNRKNRRSIQTIIHECLHSYAQVKDKTYSRHMYDYEVYPFISDETAVSPEIKSFFKVLIKNNYAYIGPDDKYEAIEKHLVFNAYHKQPRERHSNFVSTVAMAVYKEKTKYQRPNNSVDIYDYLKTRKKIGIPCMVKEDIENQKVSFYYYIDDKVTPDAIQQAMTGKEIDLSKELNMNIRTRTVKCGSETKKCVVFDIPETWEARSKIMRFCRVRKRERGNESYVAKQQKSNNNTI